MNLRAIALVLCLSLASCGALRWAFAPGAAPGQPSPAGRVLQAAAENGGDPFKWLLWIGSGLGIVGGAAKGAQLAYRGLERRKSQRRSGRDRRSAVDQVDQANRVDPGASTDL